jgi:hypothetical protein
VTTGRTAIDKTHTRQSEMVTTVESAIDKIHTAADFVCVSVRSQIWFCNSGQTRSTRQGSGRPVPPRCLHGDAATSRVLCLGRLESAIAMLGMSDLKILVKKGFDRGFIDAHVLGFEHFEEDLRVVRMVLL